ncbi:hypothetical protein KCU93_g4561, partial [Aureobasidium melanogenum]
MCLPVCRHGCFVFGVLINILLLSLTIWCAHSGKPFAVWVSLLIAFLLAFVFVVTITFGHLRYEPARRGSSSYIVPLNDEEIELYHIGSSPLSAVNEEPSEAEMYRRHLAERPLPPEPAHRRRRSGRGSPFPTLISPLSDPFIEQDTRLPAQNGRNTIRLVPESSLRAIIKAINNKPLDCESHDPPILLNRAAYSSPAKPLDLALIHPAFRDYNEGSLNSPRNLSLPRERCLDVTPPTNAAAIPIPRAYLATDTISRTMSTYRPLLPLPVELGNAPTPPPHLEEVNEVSILRLRIAKRDSATSQTVVERPEIVVAIKSEEKPGSKSGAFDTTPSCPYSMSEAEKIITGLVSEQDIQEVDQNITNEVECKPIGSPTTETQAPQTPARLDTPIILVQQATPTTPKSIQYPVAALEKTLTIRLVSPFLELPGRSGHGSRRKK